MNFIWTLDMTVSRLTNNFWTMSVKVRIVQLQVGLHQIVCILIEHAYMCVVWQENWLIVWFSYMGKSGYIDQWVTSITFFFINFYIEIKHFPTPSCILFFSMFTSHPLNVWSFRWRSYAVIFVGLENCVEKVKSLRIYKRSTRRSS